MTLEKIMAKARRYESRPRRRAFAWFTWGECGFEMEEFVWTERRLSQLVGRCRERGYPFSIYLDVNGEPDYEEVFECSKLATA